MIDCFLILEGRKKKQRSSDSLGTIIDYYWFMSTPLSIAVNIYGRTL